MERSIWKNFRGLLQRFSGRKRRIGLALGGGGAKGLAHIPMLEKLDSLGVRPDCIAGTSIGAVIGALYASGMSGSEIRSLVDDTVIKEGDSPSAILRNLKKLLSFMDVDFFGSGILKGDSFMKYFYDAIKTDTFQDLQIPLRIVATDFWKSAGVVLSSGDLISSVKASMGLPGLFSPVRIGGNVLIDGGAVDPVPWDVLDDCDITIAVDVLGRIEESDDDVPSAVRAVTEVFDIMQRSMVRAGMDMGGPDIYIRPEITGIGLLEFHRAQEIYAFAEDAAQELEMKLKGIAV